MKRVLTAVALTATLIITGLFGAASSAQAKVLSYGQGVYLLNRPIVLQDWQILRGAGVGKTILKAAPGYKGMLIVNAGVGEANPVHHPGVEIRDLSVDGSGTASRGIYLKAVDDLVVKNVEVYNTTGNAIEHRGIQNSPYTMRQTWANVTGRDSGGWCVYNGLRTRKVTYTDIRATGCRAGGMTIDHSEASAVGIIASRNGGNGVWIRNVYSINLTNVVTNGNGGNGMFVQGAVYSLGTNWTAMNNKVADVRFSNSAPQPSFNYGVTRNTMIAGLTAGHTDVCQFGNYDNGDETPLVVDSGVDVQIVGQRLPSAVGCSVES
jgi:hypothetical protein